MSEWTKIDHKRKQRQSLRESECDKKVVKESWKRNDETASNNDIATDLFYIDTKPAVVRNLIGSPVIRRSVPSTVRPEPSKTTSTRGILRVPNLNIVRNHESEITLKDSFDVQTESWPQLEDGRVDEQEFDTSMSGFGWSNIVKQPPKPKLPPPIPKPKDQVDKGDVDHLVVSDTEEPKKKRKKKKKDKDKTADPQTLDLGALIDALKPSQKNSPLSSTKVSASAKPKKNDVGNPRNVLDSSAPAIRRGKEREAPKKKKMTPMRKTIIKEREERKKALEEGQPIPSILDVGKPSPLPTPGMHNRHFRDYCTHLVTPELDSTVELLLSDLVRFQDRVYKNEPLKLKTKRRYVCGLREVGKQLELKKVKVVIVAPNLDKIEAPGGINHTIEKIIQLCRQQGVPVVFALSRRRLAYVLKKKFKIGCVGITSFAGAEDKFKKMNQLVAGATREYNRKKDSLLQDQSSVQHQQHLGIKHQVTKHQDNSNDKDCVMVDIEEEDDDDNHDMGDSTQEEEEGECESVPLSQWNQLFPSTPSDTATYTTSSTIPVIVSGQSTTAQCVDDSSPEVSVTYFDHNLSARKTKDDTASSSFSWNLSASPFVPT